MQLRSFVHASVKVGKLPAVHPRAASGFASAEDESFPFAPSVVVPASDPRSVNSLPPQAVMAETSPRT